MFAAILLVLLLLFCSLFLVNTLMFNRPQRFPSLEGRHVFITGGSSGIGLSIAKRCLAEGAFVTLVARTERNLRKAAHDLVRLIGCNPNRILLKVVDVRNAAGVTTAIEEGFQWKPIDILVCNAGFAKCGFVEDVACEDLEAIYRTNFLGSVYPVQAALPLMKKRSLTNPSCIVFINSLSSVFLAYGSNMYTAAKYAQRGFAECLRMELLQHNIGVHVVIPGYTETPLLQDVDDFVRKVPRFWRRLFLHEVKPASADAVAEKAMEGVKRGSEFLITTAMDGFLIGILGRGVFPPETFHRLVLELLLTWPLRIFSFLWIMYVNTCHPR